MTVHSSTELKPWYHRPALQIASATILFIAYLLVPAWPLYRDHGLFWDAQVYAQAVQRYLGHGQPYLLRSQLNFVYPPIFLEAAAWLANIFPAHLLKVTYLTLNSLAVFALPVLLSRWYVRVPWLTVAGGMLLFAFHPSFSGVIAFLSGNISSLLYALILAAGVPGIRRNRWAWFYLVLVLCSLIKAPVLTFLLLPCFLGRKQLAPCALAVGAALLGAFLSRTLSPSLNRDYLRALSHQLITLQDVGFGILRYLLHGSTTSSPIKIELGMFLHLLLVGSACWILWRICSRDGEPMPQHLLAATVLVLATLANPRLMGYDADIAVIPATVLIVEAIRALLRNRVPSFFLILPTALFFVLVERSALAALFVFLVVSLVLSLASATLLNPDQHREHEALLSPSL